MREAEFYRRRVKPKLEEWGFKVYRVESGETSPGIPDVWVTKKGVQIWIELKSVKDCKKIVSPKWQPGQVAFGRQCIKDEQPWALMILVGNRFMWTKEPKEKYTIDELEDVV